jgi:hypothetical protein
MNVERHGEMILMVVNRRTRRKICPGVTLSNTSPILTDLGANPGLHGERPMTSHLIHNTDYDQIKENEMGGACIMHGGYEKCV